MSHSDTLDKELRYYKALSSLVDQACRDAEANPFNRRIVELGISAKRGDKAALKKQIQEHFDAIQDALAECFLVRLVAAFEVEAFKRVANTIGEARRIIKEHVPETVAFSKGASRLVRSDEHLRSLAGIEDLVKAYPSAHASNLFQLRAHRNHIAHGNRPGVGAKSSFQKPDEVHQALVEILDVVAGASSPAAKGSDTDDQTQWEPQDPAPG